MRANSETLFFQLTGPKPKEIKVGTFRIDYLIRTLTVEKLSSHSISQAFTESEKWLMPGDLDTPSSRLPKG